MGLEFAVLLVDKEMEAMDSRAICFWQLGAHDDATADGHIRRIGNDTLNGHDPNRHDLGLAGEKDRATECFNRTLRVQARQGLDTVWPKRGVTGFVVWRLRRVEFFETNNSGLSNSESKLLVNESNSP